MSKQKQSEQAIKTKQNSRRKMQIGASIAVIAIALVIIFSSKKNMNDTTATPMAPMFKKQGELTIQKQNGDSIVTIDIEIADDEQRREIGLMGRPVMGEKEGMLFIFEEEHIASFWMKNTILPLDMLFIDKTGKIITIHKNTTPFSEQSYTASGMTLFVLEVNAGFTDKYDVKEGDRISWKRN